MPPSVKLVASETLMCGLKSIPIAGKAFEVVDAVRTRHELLSHSEQLAAIEAEMTRMERRFRELVEEEIRATLDQLRQPGLDGRTLDQEIRNLRQIREQGWEPALFEGLLANSNHLDELKRNPQHYGQVLDHHDLIDSNKIHILLDADPLRILELVPFAFAALLANQSKGVPPATIQSEADVWAFPNGGQANQAGVIAPPEQIAVPERSDSFVRIPALSPPDDWIGSQAGDRKVLHLDGLEIPFRWCPPGTFRMGSPEDEPDRRDHEDQVAVTLTRGFWMLETPVTQELYQKVTGSNPSNFQGADLPVERVSWDDARMFGEMTTARLRRDNQLPSDWAITLPTEAQWEYACRAGTTTVTGFGNSLNSLEANFDGRIPYNGASQGPYLDRTTQVRSYRPNAWGLFDMHGNVYEWCLDWYDSVMSGGVDPAGPSQASSRVLRGGGWFDNGRRCRSAFRGRCSPDNRGANGGFRVAAVPV